MDDINENADRDETLINLISGIFVNRRLSPEQKVTTLTQLYERNTDVFTKEFVLDYNILDLAITSNCYFRVIQWIIHHFRFTNDEIFNVNGADSPFLQALSEGNMAVVSYMLNFFPLFQHEDPDDQDQLVRTDLWIRTSQLNGERLDLLELLVRKFNINENNLSDDLPEKLQEYRANLTAAVRLAELDEQRVQYRWYNHVQDYSLPPNIPRLYGNHAVRQYMEQR